VGPRDNSIKGIQKVDMNGYTLAVDGLVNTPATFTYDEVKALPANERQITLHCVEGWDATILWKGVLLNDLMGKAGVKPEAVTVIFCSVDGYTTSLPLKTVQDKQLILAYGANGLDLPPQMGYPFIVVAEDKLGYKWARWVNRITLSDDPNYKGYWERNGYSNEADVKE
jgi:DMSO/TMAO reductase YedYZ molybdopterin-dependent catalytic subunit